MPVPATWKVGPLAEASGLTVRTLHQEASIAALDTLRQRLLRLGGELATDQAPTAAMLLEALQAIGGTGPEREHTLRRHLDADQIQALRTRAAALGPAMHYLLEIEWRELADYLALARDSPA
jgi:hypothetical protein